MPSLAPRLRPSLPAVVPGRFAGLRPALPVAAVLAVHFALRMLFPNAVEPDDADLIIWHQRLALGYGDQGPLYSWLLEGCFALFGVGVVALTVLRTALLAAAVGLLYANARLVCRSDRAAWLAAYSVLLMPNLCWNALTYLTHTNLLIVASLAALYTFQRLLRDGRTRDYLLFALACGAGAQSKLNFVWVGAALVAAGITTAEGRRRLADRRTVLAAAVFAGLVLPHALWLYAHRAALADAAGYKLGQGATAGYVARTMHGVWAAAVAGLSTAAPLVFGVLAFFPRRTADGEPDADRDLARRVVVRFLLAAVAVVLVQVAGLGVTRIHERWLQPFAVAVPLWLFARFDLAAVNPRRVRAFAVLLVLLAGGYTAARAVQVGWYVDQPRGTYPMRPALAPLADAITAIAGDRPTIVAPERELGGNLLLRLPEATICHTDAVCNPVSPGPGPMVVVWNLALTGGHPIVPWGRLGPMKGEPWFGRPVSAAEVRVVELPSAWQGAAATWIAVWAVP